ncbi:hypothetical protein [Alkalicoccus halolimnae]|uniref:Uncharacterized protein n=1 Tax=Alkalicoccus halolimnae TaxID=1667239 RepID=A0A5C7FJ82_9BACI|nr:hypothetical protein [Alkalicoccus halolimnae]TXF86344.1 hypothetical protein FTX54_03670 [Alkalicoccus halolimnae]
MGKFIFIVICLCLLLFVVGCNQESAIEWKDSKEEAIESGLEQEETERESVLSIEEFEDETFVFYENMGGLGVAHIAKSEKGYGWNRSQPYNDFEVEGELAYSTSEFDMKMETGLEISVLIGKTFDSSIQEMKLLEDGTERKVKVLGENRFFYALHKKPFDTVSVSPIR